VLKKCNPSLQRQKINDTIKLVNEQKGKDKEVVNVRWEEFLKKFGYSLIGVFGCNYQVRALHFVNEAMGVQKASKKMKQESQIDKGKTLKRNFVFTM
jgi:hypothetical protein